MEDVADPELKFHLSDYSMLIRHDFYLKAGLGVLSYVAIASTVVLSYLLMHGY